MSKTFSAAEVAKHNTESDCWIIINKKVYDVTKFLKLHPGGKKVLLGVGGQECTEQFNQFHNATAVIAKYGPKLFIGDIEGGAPSKKAAAAAPKKAEQKPAASSEARHTAVVSVPTSVNEAFGDMIPYGDPSWYQVSNILPPRSTEPQEQQRRLLLACQRNALSCRLHQLTSHCSPSLLVGMQKGLELALLQ